jgi:beta-phosphoglucomutase
MRLEAAERVALPGAQLQPAARLRMPVKRRGDGSIVEAMIALEPPRAVVFDFNGTISDDEPLLAELFTAIFAEEGIAVTVESYFADHAGYSDPEIVERVLREHGRDDDETAARLLARRAALYLERAGDGRTVTPAAADFVRRVAERVPVAVASGAVRAELEAVLGASGLRGVVSAVVAAEDVEHGKPDPEGYVRALEALGAAPATALAFEDSAQGLAAALAAGMRCVCVTGTAPPDRLAGAEALVDRLDWSIPLVRGWNA